MGWRKFVPFLVSFDHADFGTRFIFVLWLDPIPKDDNGLSTIDFLLSLFLELSVHVIMGAFFGGDLDLDQWSEITRIMVRQRNRRIHSGHGFILSVPLMRHDPKQAFSYEASEIRAARKTGRDKKGNGPFLPPLCSRPIFRGPNAKTPLRGPNFVRFVQERLLCRLSDLRSLILIQIIPKERTY